MRTARTACQRANCHGKFPSIHAVRADFRATNQNPENRFIVLGTCRKLAETAHRASGIGRSAGAQEPLSGLTDGSAEFDMCMHAPRGEATPVTFTRRRVSWEQESVGCACSVQRTGA